MTEEEKAEKLALIAKPSDDDLDCYIPELLVETVAVLGREVIFTFTAPSGTWITPEGVPTQVTDVDGEMTASFPGYSDDTFQLVVDRLTRWRDDRTPVQMSSAPDKLSSLIEDAQTYILIPRRDPDRRDLLSMWTIYDHPADYPDKFVARRWAIEASGPVRTDEVRLADTLEGVRELLPAALTCLPRSDGDDPTIVETWL